MPLRSRRVRKSGGSVSERPDKRGALALTGVIPAIALSAGLLSLSPDSPVRQEYWPWLPALVLVIGVACSALFWLVFAPRRDRQDRDPR